MIHPIPKIVAAYRGGVALVSYCPAGGDAYLGHNIVVDRVVVGYNDLCVARCAECTYYDFGRSYSEVLVGAAAKIFKNWEIGEAWMQGGQF